MGFLPTQDFSISLCYWLQLIVIDDNVFLQSKKNIPETQIKKSMQLILVDLLRHYTPTRQLRSSSMNLFIEPKSNLKSYGERRFQVAAPRLSNALPHKLKSIKSLDVFKKKQLKTILFREAFYINGNVLNYY